jgi:splicing factor U2AF 35 kDa subunit
MAKHLARIHGTEEDKVNCPFYFKIGACRHSDRCSRLHHKPAFSPTLLIKHLYRHPVRLAELQQAATGVGSGGGGESCTVIIDKEQAMEDFLCFFEDVYVELSKFGRVEALHVCDNLGDHMIGHVYCKFRDEEEASDALQVMNGRFYDGRQMDVEFSPVTDFREARCRDYDEDACARGGFCNFLHVRPVPACLLRSLEDDCEADRRREEEDRRDKERDEKRARRKKRKRREERDSRKRSRKSSRRSSSRSRSDDEGDDDGSKEDEDNE